MWTRSVALRAVGVMVAGLFTSACSSSRHEPTENYYMVASNIKLPYWRTAQEGLLRAAADLNVKAEFVGPDTYNTTAQRDTFRNLLNKKPTPAGIMISAADPNLMKSEIDAALAAGIPVITVDSDAPESQRLFFVGTNNYQAGVAGGQVLAERLKGKGNVVVFTIPAQANLAERLRGYETALAGTGVKIVETIDIHGEPVVAFDKTDEIVTKGKTPVDAFVCLEASAGKEVADVLSRRKVEGKTVIAMDTDDGTLEWIEKGVIAVTVAQKPFTMAYYGLRALDDLHHNKPAKLNADWRRDLRSFVPSVIDTGSALIDRNNLSDFRKAAARGPGGAPGVLAWFGGELLRAPGMPVRP